VTETRNLSNPRSLTSQEARELADALLGRGEGFVVADEPLGPGVQGAHDAACDTFALAAASIGDHVGEESMVPWALALRLSALMIKLTEIVAFAEEELRRVHESSEEDDVGERPEQPTTRRDAVRVQ
jgi:hypothetical protein